MPELTIMREAKPSRQRPKLVTKAKLAGDFAKTNGRLMAAIARDVNLCRNVEAQAKLRTLHENARAAEGLEHFTFHADGLTPGGRDLLRNMWHTINGTRGSGRVTMHID